MDHPEKHVPQLVEKIDPLNKNIDRILCDYLPQHRLYIIDVIKIFFEYIGVNPYYKLIQINTINYNTWTWNGFIIYNPLLQTIRTHYYWLQQLHTNNAIKVVTTYAAVGVLLNNGLVLSCGHKKFGGKLCNIVPSHKNIKNIYATNYFLLAYSTDNRVYINGGGYTKVYNIHVIKKVYHIYENIDNIIIKSPGKIYYIGDKIREYYTDIE